MPLTYSQIFNRALPIILANAAVPLLGIVDTVIIGNIGNTQDIGAIAFGALIFNFVYWSFGFLRMSTTGFIAQAAGAKQWLEVRLVLGRALIVATAIALLLLFCHRFLGWAIFSLFQGSSAVEEQANIYFQIRIRGAPATLSTFALMGLLVGLGKSAHLMWIQFFLNGLNVLLDFFFAAYLEWGVKGIAWGTLIAEYCTLAVASAVVYRILSTKYPSTEKFWSATQLFEKSSLFKMLHANGDIMLRTVALVSCFAWFTNAGAVFGDTILAANHVLLQFVTFTGFFLDGYAFVAESIVGNALGAKRKQDFIVGIRRSSVLGLITAAALAVGVFVAGEFFITYITDIEPLRIVANQFLWLACIYILLSFPAYQFDAIFIGAVRSAEMRNASLLSALIFIISSYCLMAAFNNQGLWWAFNAYVVIRALSLWYYFPRITAIFKA